MKTHPFYYAFLAIFLSIEAVAKPISASGDGVLGPYSTVDFKITDGSCTDCNTLPQALWYFKDQTIAVASTHSIAQFYRNEQVQADIASWSTDNPELLVPPPLVWLGSKQVIAEAAISKDGKNINEPDGNVLAFRLFPQLATNQSYWNKDTLDFFTQRTVRLRGEIDLGHFTARTIWPLDYNFPLNAKAKPLTDKESIQSLVQFENGGAKSNYQARLLWERNPDEARQAPGHAVIGLMLNGAQGDDDEAHGGHFGIVTGAFEKDGNWSRWLVNNFYNLDSYSEKGIVAAVTPMDKYLMDLNNGQSYYRPSYMLVATFKDEKAAQLYQAAVNRVYNHFYRHDFTYNHSLNNCAGISIDIFRTLGWNIPKQGAESYLKAIAAYFYVAGTELSLDKAKNIYDYLATESTRVYPAVTFDAMSNDLIALAQGKASRTLTPLEQNMLENIESIWFVRIPQLPSSRAYGLAPVYSFEQYMEQAPQDRSQWKIIPTSPRPFPDAMRDGLALHPQKIFVVPLPVALTAMVLIFILMKLLGKLRKRRA